ncbi:hypothetical protein [Gloeobacter kilaueensis]|uniref:Uncharacterized protein n=1 Tax=Gloeobacter kilaueensis (strain ATCC BAA-2537 / CCAP 1431/1 / ULC 316 / JS1) TaxID=1183438 RepID=U5QRX5_GLOK1|nr:hypothetical protein [Gloeobacter kilaueensis]AGY60369.1 hypothetical protein GKIL_4123 [Gloeobacter kilaueensis JS1]
MSAPWWPFLVLVPAAGLYFYFKLTVKDLASGENWLALVKDGLASGSAFVLVGVTFFFAYREGLGHWLGLILVLWSLTYWASALISYQNLQTIRGGGRVDSPFKRRAQATTRTNRQQRRTGGRRRP